MKDEDSRKQKKYRDPETRKMNYGDPKKQKIYDWFFKYYEGLEDSDKVFLNENDEWEVDKDLDNTIEEVEEVLMEEFSDTYPKDIIIEDVRDIEMDIGCECIDKKKRFKKKIQC